MFYFNKLIIKVELFHLITTVLSNSFMGTCEEYGIQNKFTACEMII